MGKFTQVILLIILETVLYWGINCISSTAFIIACQCNFCYFLSGSLEMDKPPLQNHRAESKSLMTIFLIPQTGRIQDFWKGGSYI